MVVLSLAGCGRQPAQTPIYHFGRANMGVSAPLNWRDTTQQTIVNGYNLSQRYSHMALMDQAVMVLEGPNGESLVAYFDHGTAELSPKMTSLSEYVDLFFYVNNISANVTNVTLGFNRPAKRFETESPQVRSILQIHQADAGFMVVRITASHRHFDRNLFTRMLNDSFGHARYIQQREPATITQRNASHWGISFSLPSSFGGPFTSLGVHTYSGIFVNGVGRQTGSMDITFARTPLGVLNQSASLVDLTASRLGSSAIPKLTLIDGIPAVMTTRQTFEDVYTIGTYGNNESHRAKRAERVVSYLFVIDNHMYTLDFRIIHDDEFSVIIDDVLHPVMHESVLGILEGFNTRIQHIVNRTVSSIVVSV